MKFQPLEILVIYLIIPIQSSSSDPWVRLYRFQNSFTKEVGRIKSDKDLLRLETVTIQPNTGSVTEYKIITFLLLTCNTLFCI